MLKLSSGQNKVVLSQIMYKLLPLVRVILNIELKHVFPFHRYRVLIVHLGLLVVLHLHHDWANIGKADALLSVPLVKLMVDMVSISIAEQGLRLLELSELICHRLGCQINRACHSIESQMELIDFFTWRFILKFDCSLLLLIIFLLTSDLVKSLV